MSYGTTLEAEFFTALPNLKLYTTPEGQQALLVLLELRTWSARGLTDGFVPAFALPQATMMKDPESALELLADAGQIEAVEDGYQIDWSGQKTKNERESDQAEWARKKKHQRGNHSACPMTWTCRKAETNFAAATPVTKATAPVAPPKAQGAPKKAKGTAAAEPAYIDYEALTDPSCSLEMVQAYCDQEVRLTKAAVAGITVKAAKRGLEFRCGPDVHAISQRDPRDRTGLERAYRGAAQEAAYVLRRAINDRSEPRGWALEVDELKDNGTDWPMVFGCVWGELDGDSREGLQAIIDGLAPQFEHLALAEMVSHLLAHDDDEMVHCLREALPADTRESVMEAAREAMTRADKEARELAARIP
ncbi:hypothetical protein ACFXPR_16185 [Nocardia tengchongensis]|uniref:hypothetical protein n=1 Tax=Nocardia tengchongensis TaxID=2055889 RepID=UPI0036B4BC32